MSECVKTLSILQLVLDDIVEVTKSHDESGQPESKSLSRRMNCLLEELEKWTEDD